ncbi:MAG: AmmeMemoRadiSam system protein A [Lachnospiraceae bacterium]|nr:AmmeMemoRadiSam system protein A [Lachnospiraceae bacterium]
MDHPIKAAYMVPHPPIILPEVGGEEAEKIAATTASFMKVAEEIAEIKPDTIVLSSPHTVMYRDYFHISPGLGAKGSMSRFAAPQVEFAVDYDTELTTLISKEAAAAGIPAGTEGQREPSLDHGVMVPLYFIRKKYKDFRLLRIGLSALSYAEHYRVGQLITKALSKLGRKAVYVASGDLSHCQKEDGPYGLVPEGPEYDERIMNVMGRGAFGELFDFDEVFCDKAGECGHRSFVMMAGALDGRAVEVHELSHEATFGVGYGICTYRVLGEDEDRRFLMKREEDRIKEIAKQHEAQDPWVKLARKSLESFVRDGKRLEDAEEALEEVLKDAPEADSIREELLERRAGAFVSLHKDGQLRGCIGTILPVTDCVAEELLRNAVSAGTEDPRFPALRPEELPYLEYSVDVLGEPEDIDSPGQLDVKRYGVIVSSGYRRGLLLPDLDGVDSVEEQIDIARRKAGIKAGEKLSLQRFEVIRHH